MDARELIIKATKNADPDHEDVFYFEDWIDPKVIAEALTQARKDGMEEAANIAESFANNPTVNKALVIAKAIRQAKEKV